MSSNVRIDVYFMIQYLFFLYLIFVRPYDNIIDNLIAILNDAFYLCEVAIVFGTNQDYLRNDFVCTNLMIYLVVASGAITFVLLFIQFFINSCKWIVKRYKSKKISKNKNQEVLKTSCMVIIPKKTLYGSDIRDPVDLRISNGDLSTFYREDSSRTFDRSLYSLHTFAHNDVMKTPMKKIVPIQEEAKESVGFDLSDSEEI